MYALLIDLARTDIAHIQRLHENVKDVGSMNKMVDSITRILESGKFWLASDPTYSRVEFNLTIFIKRVTLNTELDTV